MGKWYAVDPQAGEVLYSGRSKKGAVGFVAGGASPRTTKVEPGMYTLGTTYIVYADDGREATSRARADAGVEETEAGRAVPPDADLLFVERLEPLRHEILRAAEWEVVLRVEEGVTDTGREMVCLTLASPTRTRGAHVESVYWRTAGSAVVAREREDQTPPAMIARPGTRGYR